MILTTLKRSARKVLLTRGISENDRVFRRWQPSEDRQFMLKAAAVADDLRPTANLEVLPSAGDRLMVEMAIFTSAAYRVLLEGGVPS